MPLSPHVLLPRRDAILEAVARVADVMAAAGPWRERVPEALAILGRATGVSRVYIFDVAESAAGRQVVSQRFEWVAEGVTPQIDVPELQGVDLIEAGFERWGADLAAGRAVFGDVEDFPASERPLLEMQQILSILIQPIFAGDRWWGFMGFDACSARQEWSRVEVDTLRIAARTISGAIHQQDREAEMRRRVELLSEAVIDTGPEGDIRYVNAAWKNLLGSEPQAAVGRPLADFVHAEDTSALDRLIGEAQRAGGPVRGELRMRRTDGTGCAVVLAVTPLPHGGLVCAAHDMTAWREREAALAGTRAKSEFLAKMSHELRTPLNAIIGLAYLATQGDVPEPHASHLRKIERASRGLLSTINDVLDFSKIEANAMTLEQEPFALAALLAGVESVVLPLARKQGLGWNIEVEPGAPAGLVGDSARLEQVLINLAANAVKFTHTGTVTVRVAVEAADLERATLRFEVRDTGIGMTPEQAEKVFETYRQADNGTTRRFGGTGLGLAIAKHLVEAMGGRIAVRTAPGAGSTFTASVPFARALTDEPSVLLADRAPACAPPAPGSLQGRRVLLAEDNEFNQEIFLELIGRTGAEVVLAPDGAQAVARWRDAGPFHLVLMDLHMPEMDGLEAAREIRRLERNAARVRIVALTANVTPADRERCRDAGMDDFQAKPIVPELFLSRFAGWVN